MESGGYLPLSFAIELIRHCLIEHRDEFNMVAKVCKTVLYLVTWSYTCTLDIVGCEVSCCNALLAMQGLEIASGWKLFFFFLFFAVERVRAREDYREGDARL